jgi:hypothetical protein
MGEGVMGGGNREGSVSVTGEGVELTAVVSMVIVGLWYPISCPRHIYTIMKKTKPKTYALGRRGGTFGPSSWLESAIVRVT